MNDLKTYDIFIKYTDGTEDTTQITTGDIKWSIDQYIRNRNSISELKVDLKEDGTEEQGDSSAETRLG